MSIYKKLLEVQKEVGAVAKTSNNPFFKSKYFCVNKLIEVVSPVLSKNGLVLLQPIIDGKVFSKIFDSESSESVESCIDLPNLTDPQKLGSAITYYRRYTLASLMALQAEDNDGNGLKPKPVEKQKVQNWTGLLSAIADGSYTKEKALSQYLLTPEEVEKINKVELIKK